MEVEEMNKFLSKFVRKNDGSYYKETSLLSIRAALDRYLKSLPHKKKYSICNNLFHEANKALDDYLKHFSSIGQIAGTVHKDPLGSETIQKFY